MFEMLAGINLLIPARSWQSNNSNKMTQLEELQERVNESNWFDRVEHDSGLNPENCPVAYIKVFDDPDDDSPYDFCGSGEPGESCGDLLDRLASEALDYLEDEF